MSEEVIKVLDNLAERFGIAVDWTSTNIIPYLQELSGKCVKYELATSIMWLILGIIMLLIAIVGGYYWYKNIGEYEYGDDDFYVFWALCVIAFAVTGIAVTITQTLDIITYYTFPEKIVIEEIKSIYSSMK